jgi:hypothetical protein
MHPKLMQELAAKRIAYESGHWPAFNRVWAGICFALYRNA